MRMTIGCDILGALRPLTHSPATVELTRADTVESAHAIDIVVIDRNGSSESWGDPDRPVIARSAIKSIQALPLISTGAADALEVTDDELALACSSHGAEADHVAMVEKWLTRIGLSDEDLECGTDQPSNESAAADAIRSGRPPAAIFNCCSGKHAGYLTTAVHLGEPTTGYIHRQHSVQQRVELAVSVMTGAELGGLTSGIDGCGVPVFALPLRRLALAMARLVDPVDLPDDTAVACTRLSRLLPSRSHLVSGTQRTEEVLAAAANEPIISKNGAEGVFMAALPDQGLGIALKARDGARRAAEQAIWGVLNHLGALSDPRDEQPILNKSGREAGTQRIVLPR